MPVGLDDATAAAGFVSLVVTLFDGCVRGFVLLSALHELGHNAEILRCQVDFEHYRLDAWAETVGLFKMLQI